MFEIHKELLNWYDIHHRELPWRISPKNRLDGLVADPYRVWLSEIMLQQTTVTAVKPYFEKFLGIWPDVNALASADLEEVLQAWAGLGYYSRARNLKKCADLIASEYDGKFPSNAADLEKLPGIGPYTAAAIAAIAFDEQVAVVDGNIERVFTRVFAIKTPLPKAKPEIKTQVAKATPADRPGDFAQGLMDLGSSICTPKRPNCMLCPLNAPCRALNDGEQELYPFKLQKKKKPKRVGAAFIIEDQKGAIFLRKRPETGLLAQMSEVPTSNWNSNQNGETGIEAAPVELDWKHIGKVRHVFTHFELTLEVYFAKVPTRPNLEGWWSSPDEISNEALPNLMRKVLACTKQG